MIGEGRNHRAQFTSFDGADKLRVHHALRAIDHEQRIEPARRHGRPVLWDEGHDDAGVEMGEKVRLTVEDQAIAEPMNVELCQCLRTNDIWRGEVRSL